LLPASNLWQAAQSWKRASPRAGSPEISGPIERPPSRWTIVTGCRDLRAKRHIKLVIYGGLPMRLSFAIRAALIALTAATGLATAA
jgi:hypothetical protein